MLVRMRDDDMNTMPGVTIEDMGYKMGLNGVDNAKLRYCEGSLLKYLFEFAGKYLLNSVSSAASTTCASRGRTC